jgi:homoserine kinase type II
MADEQSSRVIYWAYHWYDEDERTLKTIGHFSSEEKARAAIDAVRTQPGFRDHPEGFGIDRCGMDVVCWSEGFVSE